MSDESTSTNTTHACRTCGKTISESEKSFPFCSPRCRMADLGKWFDGEYKISREIKDSDIETVD